MKPRFGCPRQLAVAHLVLRLQPVNRALLAAVESRDVQARMLLAAGATSQAITRNHAAALLKRFGAPTPETSSSLPTLMLDGDEPIREAHLREQARLVGARLPLDAFVQELGLDEIELAVLVLCAAVEVDHDYETIFAYIHDDEARRVMSTGLACTLSGSSLAERTAARLALGPFGRLHRHGLVVLSPRETGPRDELRLTASSIEALLGAPVDFGVAFRDPEDVELPVPVALASDAGIVSRAAEALAEQQLDVVAVWGRSGLARDVVAVLGERGGFRVRRYAGGSASVAATGAAALNAALWIDFDELGESRPAELLEVCRRTQVPLILTGSEPWRPTDLLAKRRYMEIPIVAPDHASRQVLWRSELPELAESEIDHTATSFDFEPREVRAAVNVARASAAIESNGHVVTAAESLRSACFVVARKHGEKHTTLVIPRRRAEDLVLAPDLHARVLDLVHNFRALPRVMHDWGFASRVSGGGLKALFTGEPGTGKTLAAEVVANELGLPMLRVDLAAVVSKWIGETEKNLDQVFNEARDSHAVLFFDEAEALFGARGDVKHGTDRYANLEVSYLLQRFEAHGGIVILATNLRDRIDPAFMRRFHVIIGFPRPAEKERRKIWQRVFTAGTPTAGDLDIPTLSRLDMTGASIIGASQTAALLAARENQSVSMRHVVRGLVRQYQREARVLNTNDLGVHAVHVGL